MAVNLSPIGGVAGQFFDNNGVILSGGKIYTYASGTTTNQATYTSAAGVTAHTNPIILDSAGRVPSGEIWLTDSLQYKFVIKTSADVIIGTYDNIIGINSNFLNYDVQEEIQTATAGQTVFTLNTVTYTPNTNTLQVFVDGVNQYDGVSYAYVETDSTTVTFTSGLHVGALVKFTTAVTMSAGVTTADLVTYDPPFTGSVATTVEDKLAQYVSVADFGAIGDGVTDDSDAIQAAFDAALRIEFVKSRVYLVKKPLNIATAGTYIVGNNARIVADYEQDPVSPSYADSLINVTSKNDVLIENLRLQYTGTYTVGGLDYGGYVSGIHVESSDRFTARNVEAYDFNRAGINVAMDVTYCNQPKILDCYLHHNRVAGVLFGNTDNGIVQNCTLALNGAVDSVGTGYGFGGWSACLPKNTILANNQAIDNYRKGLDFHAGQNGTIIGNVCARNRVYGIYTMGVKGSWTISGNTVTDMTWGNEFPTVSPYGIRVGNLDGQGTSEIPTSFVIADNVISSMTKTAGSMFPLGDAMVGCSYGKLTISNNIVDVGAVSQIHASDNGVTGTPGNYYDISFVGNQFTATSCDSASPPIYIRSSKNRKKIFSGNHVSIGAVSSSTTGVVSYDNTSITNNCFVAVGNTIDAPTSAWSSGYDPIYIKRTTQEEMSQTIVNGVSWRDWDSYRFVFAGTGGAAPSTNYWTQGSVFWNTNTAAGGVPGYYCVTAGSPGTWKAMANIAA